MPHGATDGDGFTNLDDALALGDISQDLWIDASDGLTCRNACDAPPNGPRWFAHFDLRCSLTPKDV
jgi:hypothetical protein